MAMSNEAKLTAWTAAEDRLRRTYEVWHRDVPDFQEAGDGALFLFPAGYTHVADVVTSDVERVFQLTNSIDQGWWLNAEVAPTAAVTARGGARSTSVGDVVVAALALRVEQGQPVWRRWTVDPVGLRGF